MSSAQTVTAELERTLREVTAELEAAKRGSFTEKSLADRFERLAAIVAENAGPDPTGPKAARVRKVPAAA